MIYLFWGGRLKYKKHSKSKSRTTLELLLLFYAKKKRSKKKNSKFKELEKSGKNGHFAKATVGQNGQR